MSIPVDAVVRDEAEADVGDDTVLAQAEAAPDIVDHVVLNGHAEFAAQLLSVFDYDADKITVTPNGIDPRVFCLDGTLDRDDVLVQFPTMPYEGSLHASVDMNGADALLE